MFILWSVNCDLNWDIKKSEGNRKFHFVLLIIIDLEVYIDKTMNSISNRPVDLKFLYRSMKAYMETCYIIKADGFVFSAIANKSAS